MKPENRQQILPLGLLIAGLVCGAICFTLDGTALWVLTGVGAALIVAGLIVASRTPAAQREKKQKD
jgi:hypothetical protein